MLHCNRPGCGMAALGSWRKRQCATKREGSIDMATKAKAAGEKLAGTEAVETAMKTGSEALKNGFEKAAKGYDQFFSYSKETVEAYVKSANVAGKGVETLQNETLQLLQAGDRGPDGRHQGADGHQVGPRGVRAADRFRQVGVRHLCRRDDQAGRDLRLDDQGARSSRSRAACRPGWTWCRPRAPA